MSTSVLPGKGLIFSISTDGTTYTVVHQVKTTQFSGAKSDLEDVTNMDSTGAFREYHPTLLDAGQLAISGVFSATDAGQLAFNAAFVAQTLLTCKVQYPPIASQTTGLLRSFTGYIQDNNIDSQFDKATAFNATIKITGPITQTPGS